jgi:hypothetical protein
MVNVELVRRGYAYSYSYGPNLRYQEYFLRLEKEAQAKIRLVEQLLVSNKMVECKDETPTFLFSVYITVRHGIRHECTDWLNPESGNSGVGRNCDTD